MMVKKPYAKPVILRVELNHEQAVLSTCSRGVTSLSTVTQGFCRSGSPVCRRGPSSGGDDNTATS